MNLHRKIEEGLSSDLRLLTNLTAEENGVVPGLVSALMDQLEQWTNGQPGLNVKDNLVSEPAEDNFVRMTYGTSFLGKVRKGHVKVVSDAISDWTTRIKEWEEYRNLERTVRDLPRVEQKLREEIAVIVLRRGVLGRCKYCPL